MEVGNLFINLTIILSSRCEIEFIRKGKKIRKDGKIQLRINSHDKKVVEGGKVIRNKSIRIKPI